MAPLSVARHYLCGWFFFDFISALPIDLILEVPLDHSQRRSFRIINVLKLLRLVRLQKLVRYISRWNEDLAFASSHSLATQLIGLAFFVLLFLHVNACIQFLVPLLAGFPETSWPRALAANDITDTCALLCDEFQAFVDANATAPYRPRHSTDALVQARGVCYSHAVFQALSQMLCIGFGLVHPSRTEEVWVTIVSMFMGASVYAITLAFAVNIFSTVDYPSRVYKNTLEVLNEFMVCGPAMRRTDTVCTAAQHSSRARGRTAQHSSRARAAAQHSSLARAAAQQRSLVRVAAQHSSRARGRLTTALRNPRPSRPPYPFGVPLTRSASGSACAACPPSCACGCAHTLARCTPTGVSSTSAP